MALYQKLDFIRSTIYVESFIIVSRSAQNAQFLHYTAVLYKSILSIISMSESLVFLVCLLFVAVYKIDPYSLYINFLIILVCLLL